MPWFQKQFEGLKIDVLRLVKSRGKNKNEIQAVTGATITSRAVITAVKDAGIEIVNEINRKKLKGKKVIKEKIKKVWPAQSVNPAEAIIE